MDELILTLKKQLIEALNLEDIQPEDIDTDTAFFNDGLGLDSIDALEIILILEKNYGLRIDDPKEGMKVFYSIRTLAEYIEQNRK